MKRYIVIKKSTAIKAMKSEAGRTCSRGWHINLPNFFIQRLNSDYIYVTIDTSLKEFDQDGYPIPSKILFRVFTI